MAEKWDIKEGASTRSPDEVKEHMWQSKKARISERIVYQSLKFWW